MFDQYAIINLSLIGHYRVETEVSFNFKQFNTNNSELLVFWSNGKDRENVP